MPELPEDKARSVEEAERHGAPPKLGERLVVAARPDLLVSGERPYREPSRSEEVPWEDTADILAEAARHKRKWQIQGKMPSDWYGALAAKYGVGKTMVFVDLAVSTISGGKWLGAWPVGQGRVMLVYPEGDRYEYAHRIEAVARHKGVKVPRGMIHSCLRPPRLGNTEVIKKIREDVEAVQPALVLFDSFYLSQGSVSGRVLSEMGELLWPLTEICLDNEAALLISVHWTKTGSGTDADRIPGSGIQEWSRIAMTVDGLYMKPKQEGDVTGRTEAYLGLRFVKGAYGEYTVKREMWSDDHEDLNSKLYYKTSVYEGIEESKSKAGGKAKAGGVQPAVLEAAAFILANPGLSLSQMAERTEHGTATFSKARRYLKEQAGRSEGLSDAS